MSKKSTLAAVAILIQAWVLAPAAWAAPGDLDHSFGQKGKVRTNFTAGDDMVFGVAIQPDGKIVAAGGADFEDRFALARYDTGGTLDASFGDQGKVLTSLTGGHDVALDVAVQPDGKIVAVGTGGFNSFALARYEGNGTLDPSFDGDGMVLTEIPRGLVIGYAVAIQPDGKIVVAGRAGRRFALARYDTDGALDPAFGDGGIVLTNFTRRLDHARGVAIQPDGKIVAAGRAGRRGGRFALARYDSDGALDPSFGRDGRVVTNFTPGEDSARDVAIQPDGKIVAAGRAAGSGDRFALARYRTDGTLDPTFGSNGKVLTNFTPGSDLALGIAIQPNRRIVAAGHAGGTRAAPRDHRFAIARYRPNGALDRTFSGNGKRMVNFTPGDDWAQDVALQPDGKIVAAGRAGGAGGQFALARFAAT
jgi:uncharacterized delta-60 repeat protein